jgi:hypothetical protein
MQLPFGIEFPAKTPGQWIGLALVIVAVLALVTRAPSAVRKIAGV